MFYISIVSERTIKLNAKYHHFKSAKGTNNSIYTDALIIRKVVFVDEQHVPLAEEVDQYDQTANHLVGYYDNKPVCCARILQQDENWF